MKNKQAQKRCRSALSLSTIGCVILGALSFAIAATAAATPFKDDFTADTVAQEPASFAAVVGDWYVADDKGNKVFVVDGRKWAKGKVAAGVADKARALYGDRYAEFLDRVQAFSYFPLAMCKKVDNFTEGEIGVKFKSVSGRIDQCAGIVFNLRPNGDYLIFRANALEHNAVLWKYHHGKRNKLQWVKNVEVPIGAWHTLAVKVEGTNIQGFYNGKQIVDYKWEAPIEGKVGLWSKADSVMYFDDFQVYPKEKSDKKN